MAQPLSVVIVNDYEVVVRGLAALLEPYADRVRVVGTTANGDPSEPSDIILYDTFAASQGKQLDCSAVLATYRGSRLVIYTWQLEEAHRNTSLGDKIAGYVSKTSSAEQLVSALEQVHAGGTVGLPDAVLTTDVGDWPGSEEGLSARESEILSLIVQGLSNEQIADRAYLSINTVKSYIRTSYRKIGVTSRSQALLWGIDHGFRPAGARTAPTGPVGLADET